MYEERHALTGKPLFHHRLSIDEADTKADEAQWAAMGRNRAHDAGVWGALVGAGFAGAGTVGINRWQARNPLPPRYAPQRMPHPVHPGLGIHGNVAAPAA